MKLTAILFAVVLLSSGCYIVMATRHHPDMTLRQRILKAFYPAVMWLGKLSGKNGLTLTHAPVMPPVSFYSLKTELNEGELLDFSRLKGKYVLLVNTASSCGYTGQYEALQQLFARHASQLTVIGFPANDFGGQEPGTDTTIAAFCKRNYGVSFPIALKSQVRKGASQHEVFKWLTDPARNGWNTQEPLWNFTKFLVDREGRLIYVGGPSADPGAVTAFLQ